jgi:hypothetical protein
MLVTMDGNDSLKRVLRRGRADGDDEVGRPVEREDNRDAGDGYFLSREKVDEWAKKRLADTLPTDDNVSAPSSLRRPRLRWRVFSRA